MQTLRPRDPTAEGQKSVRSRAFVVSVAVHIVIAIVFAQALIEPGRFMSLFRERSEEVRPERIGFLMLPRSTEPARAQVSGGDGRAEVSRSRRPPAPRVLAPAAVPTSLPAVPAQAQRAEPEGSGPIVGAGGPARGIRPTYTDPRIWRAPGDIVSAPRTAPRIAEKTATQRLDSVIASVIQPFNDSIAAQQGRRQPGDWTFERGGEKWGIDSRAIRLGKVSIPTAVLALLPINRGGNPVVEERNRASAALNADIQRYARQGMNEADFRKAVRSIRERKERERAALKDSEPAKQTRPTAEPAAQPSAGSR